MSSCTENMAIAKKQEADYAKFVKLIAQVKAVCPLCDSSRPSVFCTPEEKHYKRLYLWLNVEIEKLIDIKAGGGQG